jgi:myo-inositol 2-dehydrogenase / D-chiro-inositol 1-dehydrogenase
VGARDCRCAGLAFGVDELIFLDPTRPPDNFLEGPAAPSSPAWDEFGTDGAVGYRLPLGGGVGSSQLGWVRCMADQLRYGVVGAGMMGREHMRNIVAAPGGDVVAIADPHAPSIEAAREIAPEVAAFEDIEPLLARDDLDVLVIATPNFTHRKIVEQAIASGLHLLIEKPLCTTVADCLELEALLEGYSGIAWVGMEYRYSPPVARLIEEVRGGAIGTPRMVSIREHRFPFLPKVGDWNRFARNTGGTLVEKCCHFFDLMLHLVEDEPVRVFASGGQDVNHLDERYDGEAPDIIDNAYVIVDFAGGARAMLDLCMFAEQSRHQTEIVVSGEAGQVEVAQPEGIVWIGDRELPTHPKVRRDLERLRAIEVSVDETALRAGSHHGATYYQHQAFQRAVREGDAPEVGLREGLMAVAVGQAAEQSVVEGRAVTIEEVLKAT